MKAYFISFWLRLTSVVCVVLAAYRIYMRPTVLTVAVGSLDGETNKSPRSSQAIPQPRIGFAKAKPTSQLSEQNGRVDVVSA